MLGYPHPDYLSTILTSKQIAEWKAYSVIEPFGPQAHHLQSGIIAHVIANTNRKKGSKPFRPEDFALGFENPDKIKFKDRAPETVKSVIKSAFKGVKSVKKGQQVKRDRGLHKKKRKK